MTLLLLLVLSILFGILLSLLRNKRLRFFLLIFIPVTTISTYFYSDSSVLDSAPLTLVAVITASFFSVVVTGITLLVCRYIKRPE